MKIILTESNLVFRKEKDWVNKQVVYGSFNSITGAVTIPSESQYKRSCVAERLTVETDGTNIIPMLGTGVKTSVYVYLYDSNNNYIGYAYNDSQTAISSGTEYSILNYLNNYKDGSGNFIDKDTAIASTKYIHIVFRTLEDNTGLYVKVR